MTITVKGVKYPLQFGMLAVELIASEQLKNPSGSITSMLIDIVYGGMFNALKLKGEQAKTLAEVSEIVYDLLDEDGGQVDAIWQCFKESKAGAKMLGSVKKKQEEAESQNP